MKFSVLHFAAIVATTNAVRLKCSGLPCVSPSLFHAIFSHSNRPLPPPQTQTRNLRPTVECTLYSTHGFTPPDAEEVPEQYLCTDSDEYSIRMDNAQAMMDGSFPSGHKKLRIPKDAISMDDTVEMNQFIAVEHGSERRQLTKTGTYSVLVVRVVDGSGNSVKSAAQLYDDVFNDENNLVGQSPLSHSLLKPCM